MNDLFAKPAPVAPPETAPTVAPVIRPQTWRAPDRPREEPCVRCGGAAIFGEGRSWFCRTCVPHGFLPHTRGAT